MKNKHFFFVLFLRFFNTMSLKALDTASVMYMPLAVGNVWVYVISSIGHNNSYSRTSIVKDSIINNKRYFYKTNASHTWVRTDTTTGSYYYYDSANSCDLYDHEGIIDSLAQTGGRNYNCHTPYANYSGIQNMNIFGINTPVKSWIYSVQFYSRSYAYAKYFGYYQEIVSSPGGGGTTQLVGCVINGIVYGDTSVPTEIKPISTEIPSDYQLFQNYPNPFNPTTKIKFDVPSVGHRYIYDLHLVVYDALGREVVTLINDKLQPGTYEVDFDGSNFPSGVYFYSLIVDNNIVDTKKMIILK